MPSTSLNAESAKQYVGEMQNPLYILLNGHRNDITHRQTEKPVGAHFNRPSPCKPLHYHLRNMILDVMRSQG